MYYYIPFCIRTKTISVCLSVRPFLVTSLCCCWFLTGNKVWPCLKVTRTHTLRVVRWISITQKPLGFHNLVYFIRRIKITLIYLWLESSGIQKEVTFCQFNNLMEENKIALPKHPGTKKNYNYKMQSISLICCLADAASIHKSWSYRFSLFEFASTLADLSLVSEQQNEKRMPQKPPKENMKQ